MSTFNGKTQWKSETLGKGMLDDFYTRAAPLPTAPVPRPAPVPTVSLLTGAARPAPLARARPTQLTVSWASTLPQHDLLSDSGRYELIPHSDGTTTAHDPHGRCMASVATARVNTLWGWYLTKNTQPTAADFAREVSACASFYSSRHLNLRNHWSTPPLLTAQLAKAVRADTERFSSPMNASTSFRRHYSYRPADAAFGFAYDAYSARFRGSWYMNPEYDAEELYRSMRWARESVRSDAAANLGVAIVPCYRRAAHTKLLGTPGVHVLATMSPGFRFIPQDAWKGGEDLSTGTKFAVDIVVFYNKAGRRAYGGGLHRGGHLAQYLLASFKLDQELTALPELDRAGNFAADAARTGPTKRLRGPPRFHLAPPEAPMCPPQAEHRAGLASRLPHRHCLRAPPRYRYGVPVGPRLPGYSQSRRRGGRAACPGRPFPHVQLQGLAHPR